MLAAVLSIGQCVLRFYFNVHSLRRTVSADLTPLICNRYSVEMDRGVHKLALARSTRGGSCASRLLPVGRHQFHLVRTTQPFRRGCCGTLLATWPVGVRVRPQDQLRATDIQRSGVMRRSAALTYESEFVRAIERTKWLDLDPPTFCMEVHPPWFDKIRIADFSAVVRGELGALDYREVAAQCLSIHYRLRPVIQGWLGCPVYYTLGWIDDETDRGMYKFDEAFIMELLRSGQRGPEVSIHAWLTLPSMEIIDVSLPTTLAIAWESRDMLGGAITRRADELKGMTYKPMLVGDEFLRRTGLLVEWC